MAQTTIRSNPDRSLYEVEIDDDAWGPLDGGEAGHMLVDDQGNAYYLAVSDAEDLEPGTLYQLTPVEAEIEEDVEIEEEAGAEGEAASEA